MPLADMWLAYIFSSSSGSFGDVLVANLFSKKVLKSSVYIEFMFLENSYCSLDVASPKGSCGGGVDSSVALLGCALWKMGSYRSP